MNRTLKVSMCDWLEGLRGACVDQLNGRFSDAELTQLQEARDDSMVHGGYLMGWSDGIAEVQQQLERAHLGDRKITVPEPGSQIDEEAGTREKPSPLTIGALRAFLACRPDLSDDLPVVVGGIDYDDSARELSGLADAVWSDTQGAFGGRLCISALGIGLADGQ